MCVKIMKTVKQFREKHEELFLALVISCLSCILYHNFIFGDKLFLYLDANDDTFQSFLPSEQTSRGGVCNVIKPKKYPVYELSEGVHKY